MMTVCDFFFAIQERLDGKDDDFVVLEHGGISRQILWREIAKAFGLPAVEGDFSDEEKFPYVGRETYYRRTGYMSSVSHNVVTAGDLRPHCLRILGPMPLPQYEGPLLRGGVAGPMRCFTLAAEGISLYRGEIALGDEGRGRHEERVPVLGQEAGVLLNCTVVTVQVPEVRRFVPLLEAAEESSDERYVLILLNASGGHRGWVEYELPEGSVVLATGHVAQGDAGRMGGWDEMLVLVPTGTAVKYRTGGGGGHVGGSRWLLIRHDGVRHEDEKTRIQRLALERFAARKTAAATAPSFNFLSLSGNRAEVGVRLSDNAYEEGGESGRLTRYDGRGQALIAVVAGPPTETLERVTVERDADGVLVLAPSKELPDSERELVLVHEYAPGSGNKRWPSFSVDWTSCPVEKLAEVGRYRGSGSDQWSLVITPTGWAQNIAAQFVNRRDVPGQKPGCTGKEEVKS